MTPVDIDQVLRESAPTVTIAPGVGPAMAGTARALAGGEAARPLRARRRRTRTAVVAAAAALCLGGTGAAAAAVYGAHTGWFGQPGTENDASEWIDTSAPDFATVATELAPGGVRLPAGVTVQDAAAQVIRQGRANPGLEQVTGIKATYVFYAQCQWKRAWLDGEAGSDVAAAALESLAHHPAFVAVDGGNVRAHELMVVSAAANGDLAALRADFAANCAGGLGGSPKAGR